MKPKVERIYRRVKLIPPWRVRIILRFAPPATKFRAHSARRLPHGSRLYEYVRGGVYTASEDVTLTSEGADTEIRALAIKCLELLQGEAPNLFGDYRIRELPDGGRVVDTDFRSV